MSRISRHWHVFCLCALEADLLSGVQLYSLAVKCGLETEVAVANTLLSSVYVCQMPVLGRCMDIVSPDSTG